MTEEPTTGRRPDRRKRHPIERGLVWAVIAILLVLVAVEYRAQRGYSNSVAAIQAATADRELDLPMLEAEQLISMSPGRELTAENGIERTYCYSWPSVFKRNQFLLNVVYARDDGNSLLRYWTGAGNDPMTIYDPDPDEIAPRGPAPPLVSGGTGNMGVQSEIDVYPGATGSENPNGGTQRSESGTGEQESDAATATPGGATSAENVTPPDDDASASSDETVPPTAAAPDSGDANGQDAAGEDARESTADDEPSHG